MPDPVPLILKIQADAFDRSISTADLLKRAKMASTKLGIKSASSWVDHELNGYEEVTVEDLPQYRMLRGQPRFFSPFRGWCPISAGDDWAADVLSAAYLFQPAGVLEHLVKDGTKGSLRLPHIPKLNRLIVSQLGFEVESVIMLGRADVWGVVEKVRNLVLDWAMELESAGVLGEGMSFTINEKSRATTVTNNYFAQNIGVAGDVDGQSSVQSNQIASGATIDPVAVQDFLQQLRQLTPMLPKNSREAVEPQVRDLETELRQRRPDGHKLHKLLASIRAVCEGAGGNLIAAGIIEGIKAMFSSGGS